MAESETFRRARELLGKQVRVFLTRDGDPQAVATGRLLSIATSGELVIEDDMGFLHYAWPLLDIEQVSGFSCGHGRSGTEQCPLCDAGIETAMCSSGDHADIPAVGDALTDEPDSNRYPYCAECLAILGPEYQPRFYDR